VTRRDLIIEAPGQRSRALRWRDRGLTLLLWGAWSRPVDAVARLTAGPASEHGLLWGAFLRDLADASCMAGALIAALYVWGGYHRVRRVFPRRRRGET
jgi:hypothetical protein